MLFRGLLDAISATPSKRQRPHAAVCQRKPHDMKAKARRKGYLAKLSRKKNK